MNENKHKDGAAPQGDRLFYSGSSLPTSPINNINNNKLATDVLTIIRSWRGLLGCADGQQKASVPLLYIGKPG